MGDVHQRNPWAMAVGGVLVDVTGMSCGRRVAHKGNHINKDKGL